MENSNGFHLNTAQSSFQATERDEKKELQAKIARANRKLKLANKKTNPSSSSKKPSKKTYSGYNKGYDQDNDVFYTKIMCDVGDLGRILLPKREVEENLPGLATKEGVYIIIREVFSNIQWRMKYRFWANQKGYIYLLDQCADFVKKNSMEAGDHLELYHDEQKNLYFTIQKKEKLGAQPSSWRKDIGENYVSMMLEASEEEDLSWRMFIEEFKDKEQQWHSLT
ncbi:hypothetical protein R6Q57_013655 [Mikania cordata]